MLLRASTCERLHHFSPVDHRPDITTVAGRPAGRRGRTSVQPSAEDGARVGSRVGSERKATTRAGSGAPARLRVLGETEALTAQELADRLVLPRERDAHPQRPYLVLNMITTADGRASLGGRSGPL